MTCQSEDMIRARSNTFIECWNDFALILLLWCIKKRSQWTWN